MMDTASAVSDLLDPPSHPGRRDADRYPLWRHPWRRKSAPLSARALCNTAAGFSGSESPRKGWTCVEEESLRVVRLR